MNKSISVILVVYALIYSPDDAVWMYSEILLNLFYQWMLKYETSRHSFSYKKILQARIKIKKEKLCNEELSEKITCCCYKQI